MTKLANLSLFFPTTRNFQTIGGVQPNYRKDPHLLQESVPLDCISVLEIIPSFLEILEIDTSLSYYATVTSWIKNFH